MENWYAINNINNDFLTTKIFYITILGGSSVEGDVIT